MGAIEDCEAETGLRQSDFADAEAEAQIHVLGDGQLPLEWNDDEDNCILACAKDATVSFPSAPDTGPVLAFGPSEAPERDDNLEVEPDEVADLSSQFPNAIVVHGLKHVADGALGNTLQTMSLYLGCI